MRGHVSRGLRGFGKAQRLLSREREARREAAGDPWMKSKPGSKTILSERGLAAGTFPNEILSDAISELARSRTRRARRCAGCSGAVGVRAALAQDLGRPGPPQSAQPRGHGTDPGRAEGATSERWPGTCAGNVTQVRHAVKLFHATVKGPRTLLRSWTSARANGCCSAPSSRGRCRRRGRTRGSWRCAPRLPSGSAGFRWL